MDNSSSCCIEEPDNHHHKHPPPPLPLQRIGSDASTILDPPDPTITTSIEVESRNNNNNNINKLPSSQYKGVVPQPNGRWGAQIYEKHQRVWLGTFNDEADAVRAYDVAAQRFRGRDAVTNFKPLSESVDNELAELVFLTSHSKAEIVDMLRKHTYSDELGRSQRAFHDYGDQRSNLKLTKQTTCSARELMFEKTLTASDVGKLNRLVIPKQHAEKHLPLRDNNNNNNSNDYKGVLLNFEDSLGKVWRFSYSYWNSSQSYVLTKGWSRFVKEKGLKAGDAVRFRRSKGGGERQLYIDWAARGDGGGGSHVQEKVVRLFGVDILKPPAGKEECEYQTGKRRNSGDLVQLESSPLSYKKQCNSSTNPGVCL